MNKNLLSLIIFSSLITAGSTFAQSTSIDKIIQDILTTQNIQNQADIDCSKVTDEQFDELGDTYMDTMLTNTKQHEAMDNMMGGEGSLSLQQAHINMGRSYLGCWSDYNSSPVFMPMMNGYYSGSGMMGGWGGYGGTVMVFQIIWILLGIIGMTTVIKWVVNINSEKNKPENHS